MKLLWKPWPYFICSLVLLALALALVASAAHAQSIQQGAITWDQKIFTGQLTPANSPPVRNIGQSAHWIIYCPNANTASINVSGQGSQNGTDWFDITDVGANIDPTQCHVLEAGGYFPYVRVKLSVLTGVGAAVTAYYSASIFPVPGSTALDVVRAVTASGGSTFTVIQPTGNLLHMVLDSGTLTTVGAVTAITNALPAGTNIIGKVGIDQTTDVTTNGVEVAPTAASAAGIVSAESAAAEGSHIFKASAGNLYSAYVTTGGTAGFLLIYNRTTAPGDGAVTPVHCVAAPANATTAVDFRPVPTYHSTGIVAVFSSTGCFTQTTSATAFLSASVK